MPAISFSRSDADDKRYPPDYLDEPVPMSVNENYFERCKRGHTKDDLFREKIGQHVADKLGYDNSKAYKVDFLPKHYQLFNQHKLVNGVERTDIYLYGSKHVLKFRSPAEFFEHAMWLLDDTKDLSDHSTCECRYATKSSGGGGGGANSARSAPKRKNEDDGRRTEKRSKRSDPAEEREWDRQRESIAVTVEAQNDILGKSWFRKGELVWAKLRTPILKPASSDTHMTSITCWPGIITAVDLKVTPLPSDDPTDLSVVHSYTYQLKLCGNLDGEMDNNKYVTVDESEALPWQVLAARAEDETVMRDTEAAAKRFMETMKGQDQQAKLKRWKKYFLKKVQLRELEKEENWDRAVVYHAMALADAFFVAHTWSQTDGYHATEAGVDSQKQIEDGHDPKVKRTYFQGLWWGSQRLWQNELVRMLKKREDLPAALLKDPSPASADMAVFLRISYITVTEEAPPTPVDPTASVPAPIYNCLVFGDLFELAEKKFCEDEDVAASSDEATKPESTEMPLPPAPEGYAYRQINPLDTDVQANIADLSGRVYPELLRSPWLKELGLEGSKETKEMLGLMHGSPIFKHDSSWQESRYVALVKARAEVHAKILEIATTAARLSLLGDSVTLAHDSGANDIEME